MAVEGYELHMVASEYVTVDLLVWRRYKMRARGIVEQMLDANPHLAAIHRTTPFIPVGVYVRIPIDPQILAGQLRRPPVDLWTDSRGYRL